MIPLASVLEPRRFLFPANLAVAMALAAAIGILAGQLRFNTSKAVKIRAVTGISVVVALIAFDAVPMSDLIAPEPRAVERSWTAPAESTAEGGRMFWNAIKDFAPYYFVGREIGVETLGDLVTSTCLAVKVFPRLRLSNWLFMTLAPY
jgi:hypothetical protein